VPPPAAHIPTSPQSGFGGRSPTLALHPLNKLAELNSMFNGFAAEAPSRIDHLAAIRAAKAAIQSKQQQQQAQVVGSHSVPTGPAGVGAGSPADGEYERGLGGGSYE
jgi:hypothetical protein